MSKKNNTATLQREISRLRNELDAAKGHGLILEMLTNEWNFVEYIKKLRLFSKRYLVMIAACDTPCGPAYTEEISSEMLKLGLHVNLCGKFRYSYGVIINSGEIVFEKISPTVSEPVQHGTMIDNIVVEIKSVGFNVPQNNCAIIKINNVNFSPGGRGLNFVVYDRITKTVLDAVNFDTYSVNIPGSRPAAMIQGILDYKKKHPGVSVLCFNTPAFPQNGLSGNEEFIIQNAVGRAAILNNLDKPVFAINQYLQDKEDIIEVLSAPKSYHDVRGVRRFEDYHGKCVNTAEGHRITDAQPHIYKRTIFLLGGCTVFGVGSPDDATIASHLQRLLNERAPQHQFIVQNYGFFLAELEDNLSGEALVILESLPAVAGDIVLCNFAMSDKLQYLNMSSAAGRPHNYGEIFFDTMHYTPAGNYLIAELLLKKLQQLDFFPAEYEFMNNDRSSLQSQSKHMDYNLDESSKKELNEYKRILTEFYNEMFGIKIGSIVMNCNPFTLGHRYLIEQAAASCDYLIIFVVQEDQSIFPFDDRLKLVDEGVADLKNVTVIPSGRFIISSLTFSEYFNKSEIQDRVVDSSMDVTLFAREIAPCLGIAVRFVGEEPYDKITKQYNDTMRAILPQHGIEFVEIPRKEWNGSPISASRVRSLLDDRNFQEISKIVPDTTLKYLIERFQ